MSTMDEVLKEQIQVDVVPEPLPFGGVVIQIPEEEVAVEITPEELPFGGVVIQFPEETLVEVFPEDLAFGGVQVHLPPEIPVALRPGAGTAVTGDTFWGQILGNLSDQLDLQAALDAKQDYDPDLSALAALSGSNVIYYRAGPNTWLPVVMGSNMTFSGGVLDATPIAGTGDKTYLHTQNLASDTWVIFHHLGKRPSIVVVDSAGTVVNGEISYIDNDTAMVQFSFPFGGTATCN